MNRFVFASAVSLQFCTLAIPPAFAQAKGPPAAQAKGPASAQTAATTPTAPAAKPKYIAPVKGVATIEVIQGAGKRVGKEIISTLSIRNTSQGSINLLRVDQTWYDRKRTVVSSATTYYRKPFLPGEVISVDLTAPLTTLGQPDVSQCTFAHANGKVVATSVKKFQ